MQGRILERVEKLLADYLDNERQAIALAPHVCIPEGLTLAEENDHIAQEIING